MKKSAKIREIEKLAERLFDDVVEKIINTYPSVPFESISCHYKEGDDYYDEDGNHVDSDDYSIRVKIKTRDEQ